MMRWSFIGAFLLVAVVVVHTAWAAVAGDVVKDPSAPAAGEYKGPLAFKLKDIDGKEVNLAGYKGKVVMLVNVASRCGMTPQYEGLEAIYKKYSDKGFVIIGIPANNFGGQEPGTESEIKAFCTSKYNVTFPMMAKLSVKGDDQTPLYQYLTKPATGGDFAGDIGWNFTKFLVDKNGQVYARFASKTKPEDPTVTAAIEKGLAK